MVHAFLPTPTFQQGIECTPTPNTGLIRPLKPCQVPVKILSETRGRRLPHSLHNSPRNPSPSPHSKRMIPISILVKRGLPVRLPKPRTKLLDQASSMDPKFPSLDLEEKLKDVSGKASIHKEVAHAISAIFDNE